MKKLVGTDLQNVTEDQIAPNLLNNIDETTIAYDSANNVLLDVQPLVK